MNETLMKKKVIIFGGSGLLGKEVIRIFSHENTYEVLSPRSSEVNIIDESSLSLFLEKSKPDIIVNCAGIISVEACEKEPLLAWKTNAIAPGIMARSLRNISLKNPATLVHISSSYVFGDDKKTYTDKDVPSPLNVYGWTKYASELILSQESRQSGFRYFIFRLGLIYGNGRNTFVDMVVNTIKEKREMSVITDQYHIPLWTRDIALAIKKISEEQNLPNGVYHPSSQVRSGVSKYDIALEIARILGMPADGLKKTSKDGIFNIPRPESAILIPSLGIEPIDWKKSLSEYLIGKYGK